MALGKYSRVDGRRSSPNYCSTATLVAFVALCLVGVWMMTSSSVVPVQTPDVSTPKTREEVKQEQVESNDGTVTQFEDSSGDLTDDAKKGDGVSFTQDEKNPNPQDNPAVPEKSLENGLQENLEKREENPVNEEENKTDDDSKKESENGESKSGDGEGDSWTKDANSDSGETQTDITDGQVDSKESLVEKQSEFIDSEKKSDLDNGEKKPEENSTETKDGGQVDEQRIEEKVEPNENEDSKQNSGAKEDGEAKEQVSNEIFPSGAQSELLNETTTQNGAFLTQAAESLKEKETQQNAYSWKVCNVTAGPDYIPCLDNLEAIKHLKSTKHYEHRERHCPNEPPTCLVSLPEGYKRPIEWPTSRDKVC